MKETRTTSLERKGWKNDQQYRRISDRWNESNGAEECCLFLRLKGLSKKAIQDGLFAVVQENVVSYSSLTRFCREAILGLNSDEASSSPKNNGLNEVNEVILLVLSDESFSSARQIAGSISLPNRTIDRRLVGSLHFIIGHLH
jgi:hypothetical protein